MMRVVEDDSVTNGLTDLLGKNVEIWCLNYFYAGKLTGVNDKFVELGTNAHVIYETGPLSSDSYKDAQPIGRSWRIKTDVIESWGLAKQL